MTTISLNPRIARQQWHVFDLRLRYKHPIKRIAVKPWQCDHNLAMRWVHWKQLAAGREIEK